MSRVSVDTSLESPRQSAGSCCNRVATWNSVRANPAPGCVGDDDFPLEVMLWVKEVEMVDSLDELKSSRSVYVKDFPNF